GFCNFCRGRAWIAAANPGQCQWCHSVRTYGMETRPTEASSGDCRSRRRQNTWVVALAALIAVIFPEAGQAASRCKAQQELVRFKASLPRLAAAVRSRKEIKIVALGSSSTAGAGASSK